MTKDSEIQTFESLKCCPQVVGEHQAVGRTVEQDEVLALQEKDLSLQGYLYWSC